MASPTFGRNQKMGSRITSIAGYSGVYYYTVEPMALFTETWSRYSLTTPGYHSKVHRMGLPFNKYGYAATRVTNWHGKYSYGWPGTTVTYEGVYATMSDVPDGFSSLEEGLAIDEAVGKALNRVKDQSANWAENIATSKQSIGMIAAMMTRVLNAYSAVRQGNMAKAAAALGVSLRGPSRISTQSKALANGWLELQYGWLPLLSDIYQTTLAIQKRRQVKAPLIRVSATTSRNKNRTETVTDGISTTSYVHEVKLTAKVILYFKLVNEDLRFAAQMGITNPLALAWELVPFSFVLDWLLPVGSYLSNFDATLGVQFLKGGSTVCQDRKLVATGSASYRGTDGYFRYESIQGVCQLFSVNRNSFATFPSQKVPHFKDPTSMQHLANAMALLRQQRR